VQLYLVKNQNELCFLQHLKKESLMSANINMFIDVQ